MAILDGQLARGNGFVVNGRMSLADIALVLSSHRWFSTPIEGRVELPAVAAHYEALKGTAEGERAEWGGLFAPPRGCSPVSKLTPPPTAQGFWRTRHHRIFGNYLPSFSKNSRKPLLWKHFKSA